MGCTSSQKQTDSYGMLAKPHVFFLIGGPGSGKGTQSENLIRDFKFKHLSSGDLLREETQKGGELAETINSYIKQGKLLPSELVVKLLKKGISNYGNRRYLFDGFPRNEQNWRQFEKQLGDLVIVRNLIYFECQTQVMVQRLLQRAKVSGRSDDNVETITKRLKTFEMETIPIVSQFQKNNNCIRIDASKTKEQVYEQIQQNFRELHIQPPPRANMIFVLGGPGSGKGTQCAILVKKYGFIHLSTGDLLREQVNTGSKLGKEIDLVIKQGKLISSDLMVRLVNERMERNNYGGRYLLDGFPRGQQNMDVWEKVMARWVNLKTVIYFQCNQQELKRRILQRGKTSGRNDDSEEIIGKRLAIFNEQTRPVIEFYKQQGKVVRFDATQTIENVTFQVERHLDSIGVFPKKSKDQRPKAIIVLGSSGSGKTTQTRRICSTFGFVHVAVGDLLREEIKQKGRHSELFEQYIKQGKLVPSDLVVRLMKSVVQKNSWKGVFVLDGFPRNKQNLTRWNEELGVQIDLEFMLLLDCEEKTACERAVKRDSGRMDDIPDIIQKKVQTFRNETTIVIKRFTEQQEFVSKVDANKTEQQVFSQLKAVLESRGFKQK